MDEDDAGWRGREANPIAIADVHALGRSRARGAGRCGRRCGGVFDVYFSRGFRACGRRGAVRDGDDDVVCRVSMGARERRGRAQRLTCTRVFIDDRNGPRVR